MCFEQSKKRRNIQNTREYFKDVAVFVFKPSLKTGIHCIDHLEALRRLNETARERLQIVFPRNIDTRQEDTTSSESRLLISYKHSFGYIKSFNDRDASNLTIQENLTPIEQMKSMVTENFG